MFPALFHAYTDADSVEIFINGKSAGKAQVKDYFAKISCIYEPGELVGVGYDADGQEIYRTSVRTADAETVLTVKTDKNILRAGGQDFCFADVYVTDKNGTVKLLPDYDVKIEVVGAASLQGYGSAAYLQFNSRYGSWIQISEFSECHESIGQDAWYVLLWRL